ncbi:anti-phage dCTP deaminase [Shewanella aestuarii]|uniref:anti-phage dCTP deaminase n=1 Tax=Shewanella aestuarii TaxID=1028752 RepID=UPI00227C363A|nr:anti-phage dCTP deaminase [Shewanella aestuarii]
MGLVAPIGVDLDKVIEKLTESINRFNFISEVVQVSNLPNLLNGNTETLTRNELDSTSISMGSIREQNANNIYYLEIFSSLVIKHLKNNREKNNNCKVYILDSLKRPEEIERLKQIYGKCFYTIGVTSPYEDRLKQKTIETADSELARKMVDEDYDKQAKKNNKYGNQTNKAFQLSDLFLNLSEDNSKIVFSYLERFVDLIFGAPIVTPTPDEHSMFLAYMSSLRSADLSRQVGSAIANEHNDIIAMGSNDVPRFGGGHYWPDIPYIAYDQNGSEKPEQFKDKRDYTLGGDKNAEEKDKIINEIIQSLQDKVPNLESEELFKLIDSTRLGDITEFGRAVHAEMSALMSAARNGIPVNKATMYCTTYPCHNCAKHIVASGIDKVFYIEPYPKSKAIELHNDSITDTETTSDNKVKFVAFTGIGPKRYQDLFSMKLGDGTPITRKKDSQSIIFNRHKDTQLRVKVNILITELNENEYINTLADLIIPEVSIPDDKTIKSTIKFFNKKDEYGCINALTEHENDYFFRVKNLQNQNDEILISNDTKVSFKVVKGKKEGVLFADEITFI